MWCGVYIVNLCSVVYLNYCKCHKQVIFLAQLGKAFLLDVRDWVTSWGHLPTWEAVAIDAFLSAGVTESTARCGMWVVCVCECNKGIIWPRTTYWTNQIESVFPSATSPRLFMTLFSISVHLSFSLSLSHEKAEPMLKWNRSKEKKKEKISVAKKDS